MILAISPTGTTRAVYTEAIDLAALGSPSVTGHISHVDPDETGRQWWADLGPIGGPRLGPYPKKSQAVQAEVAWIEENVL